MKSSSFECSMYYVHQLDTFIAHMASWFNELPLVLVATLAHVSNVLVANLCNDLLDSDTRLLLVLLKLRELLLKYPQMKRIRMPKVHVDKYPGPLFHYCLFCDSYLFICCVCNLQRKECLISG